MKMLRKIVDQKARDHSIHWDITNALDVFSLKKSMMWSKFVCENSHIFRESLTGAKAKCNMIFKCYNDSVTIQIGIQMPLSPSILCVSFKWNNCQTIYLTTKWSNIQFFQIQPNKFVNTPNHFNWISDITLDYIV